MNLQPITRMYDFLTRPHQDITDIQQRRGARLLATLMLTVAVTSTFVSMLLLFRNDGRIIPTISTVWVGVALTLLLYLINRSGRHHLASYGFVTLNFLLLHSAAYVTGDVTWLLFSAMLLVLSVILLPVRAVFLVFFLTVAAQTALGSLIDFEAHVTYVTTFTTVNVFIVTGALILVYVYHRAGIERERRAELQAANQKLRESESALEQRVEQRTHELKIAKEAAEAALQRAEKADQIKTQFLASMSHELRTPLNAILNFTEFVSLEMFGPVNAQQKDALGKSLESGRHLLSLINDVLDITKIEAGMMRLFIDQNIDIGKLTRSVVETAHTLLDEDRDVKLIADIDIELPLIEGDERRLRQILLNLLSNACKFTTSGSITLSAKNRHDHLLFCVSDTGVGIAPEDQQRIFQPFQQSDNAQLQREGTGLGLAITQWLINAHGGKLWLESTPGEGSSFYFTLPVKQALLVDVSTQ